MKVSLYDLCDIYNQEIKKRVKNKRKIFMFERNKMEYLCDIQRVLEQGSYDGGKYNIFIIFEPKVRVVMSQSIYDKIVNHYITRYVLMPKLSKYLNERNCATRKNMGTNYAIKLLKRDLEKYKKSKKRIYFLKLDIKKYFYTIDHLKILELVKEDLNEDEYNILKTILNSTNKEYVNKHIKYFSQKINEELPLYDYNKGLPIGNMTSQFLAIFYLAKLQHFIRHDLHLDYINYMDDYIFLSNDKEYLQKCLSIISNKLKQEYLLNINYKKTYISTADKGIPFLGHVFKVRDNKTIIRLSKSSKKNIKKGILKNQFYYRNNKINLNQYFCSIQNYRHSYVFVRDMTVQNILNKYWD